MVRSLNSFLLCQIITTFKMKYLILLCKIKKAQHGFFPLMPRTHVDQHFMADHVIFNIKINLPRILCFFQSIGQFFFTDFKTKNMDSFLSIYNERISSYIF